MLRKWWVAAYATFYAYLPELSVNTAHSVAKYASVSKDAAMPSRRRAGEVLHVAFLICKVLLALAFFVPMCTYDLLEYVSLGVPGEAFVLITANLLNSYFA
ncbi:hypothetical protein PHYSODRAFT_304866 [Phytophthora sojae]|uniref:Uncharacterized protein n=1 Tax=Phytophthora sojae (strain P6497) TaxID=1094619 RepID=G5A0G2_PHYSP|nr:hypothetical protein PHYSODRAFT_304866 [Phytophthora sojae]EGZ11351.1 hypothetical protein PHYSODRAFT_304866 [Phytophthora sojae]|eukprot:XP_009534096.1 hypothetical protein PHYSODRAFT_304866 [Phytophthora sojae]